MSSVQVFAADDDWLPVFDGVESSGPVRYFAAGVFPVDRLTAFSRGASLPDRGIATARATIECPAYLATASGAALRTRPVTASDGVTRFYVDQLANPETIEVLMGGRFREGVLIGGRVATVSEAMESQVLYRRFRSALRRHFTRVRAFLVGPSAHRRLLSGWRLTTAAHSPMEFDLAPDSDPS